MNNETVDVWDVESLPNASDRRFIVTGGHAGIGYFISEQLASAGAEVVLASRSEHKAKQAMEAIRQEVPGAELSFLQLDLSDLNAARRAGEQISEMGQVDGIVLNAAALAQKERKLTGDDLELVVGTNYFGNLELIAAALPALARTSGSRLVTMGSMAYRFGSRDEDALTSTDGAYRGFRTYATSKLAQMRLALEMDRQFRANGTPVVSVIAHPGGALDGLTPDRPPAFAATPKERRRAAIQRAFVQGKDRAAWPAVRAALDPSVVGGQIWGPGSATGSRPPKLEEARGPLKDADAARQLWKSAPHLSRAL